LGEKGGNEKLVERTTCQEGRLAVGEKTPGGEVAEVQEDFGRMKEELPWDVMGRMMQSS
jgi:hypothetical protein